MVENCRSSGVATEDAIVSGLAPGSAARHLDRREVDVGQIADRQRRGSAMMPKSRMPIMTSVVMTGRLMKSSAHDPASAFDLDLGARLQAQLAVGDHRLAGAPGPSR